MATPDVEKAVQPRLIDGLRGHVEPQTASKLLFFKSSQVPIPSLIFIPSRVQATLG